MSALSMEINEKGITLDGVEHYPFDSIERYKIFLGDYPEEVAEGQPPKVRKAPTLTIFLMMGKPKTCEVSADFKFTAEGKPVTPTYYMITRVPGMPYTVDLWVGEQHMKGTVEIGKGKAPKGGTVFGIAPEPEKESTDSTR